ncbi:hypothetical protein A3735_07165 [Oleiphilus sp. HI0061]|nr:hypothetical protein A3735_07165 [Oleiphilus sp. HI0061]
MNTGCDKKYGKESEEQFNRKEEKKQKFRIAIKSAYLGLLDTLGALAYEVTNPNILNLSFSLGLNEVETKLVNFVVSLKSKVTIQTVFDALPDCTLDKAYQVLGFMLNDDRKAVKQAFSNQSILTRSGFLRIDKMSGTYDLDRRIEVLSDHFIELIKDQSRDVTLLELVSDRVVQSASNKLGAEDYGHIEKEFALLEEYLKQSIENQDKGINILIYGPPGTGKTELARVISEKCDTSLFEVAGVDSEGNSLDASGRMNGYFASQVVLDGNRNLILFDEIEDIFRNNFFCNSYADKHKYVFTRLLESNPVPAIWISNDVDCMDRAIIRRFDMVIELDVPPRGRRKEIIQELSAGFLEEDDIEICASHEAISPAVIDRVAKVISQTKQTFDKQERATHFKRMVNNVLKAQGHREIKSSVTQNLLKFDPTLISCDVDIKSIPKQLASNGSGRICMYGPPGTGKTAYGNWIAKELGKQILLKKVSDLVSMWIGQTEQNIAAAFEEARQSEAVLMIDEVDSFLQDRRNVQHSWEVTQINEMLTQMESFEGVFIASTNLVDGLDMASLRRFDLKMKFDYMKPDQVTSLFQKVCEQLDIELPSENIKQKLTTISVLTPGDFAVIQRRHRFAPFENADQVYDALEYEAGFKGASSKPIGFMH